GITTNVRYLREILGHPEFVGGDYDTSFLPRAHEALVGRKEDPRLTEAALLASVVYAYQRDQKRARTLARAAGGGAGGLSAWRLAGRRWR
ncbi:MAG TPA: acetyl-CoA carboxylase biotin carboxylase subunit, partial [Myxococcaceae bacterium]|nr:acetyl-CoA carboxylase biotin carboxylase subunit [Myxococcaceae bacterium]